MFKLVIMENLEYETTFENFKNEVKESLVAKKIDFVEKEDKTGVSYMVSCEKKKGYEVRRVDGIDFDSVRFFLRKEDYKYSRDLRINGELYLKGKFCAKSDFVLYTVDGMTRKVKELKEANYATSSCRIY